MDLATELETTETVEVVEQTPEQIAEAKEREKVKTTNRLSDNIKKATWEKHEALREAKALREEVEKLKAATKIQKEPDQDDYSDHSKWQADKQKWEEQKMAEIEAKVTQKVRGEIEQANYEKSMSEDTKAYIKGREAWAKEDENFRDYEVAVDEAVKLHRTPEIQNIILKAREKGPAIVKYLGTNPDELAEIASASPQDRFYLMGKLTAKLETKQVKKVSSAPPPIESEKASASIKVDTSKESVSDYIRRKNFGK